MSPIVPGSFHGTPRLQIIVPANKRVENMQSRTATEQQRHITKDERGGGHGFYLNRVFDHEIHKKHERAARKSREEVSLAHNGELNPARAFASQIFVSFRVFRGFKFFSGLWSRSGRIGFNP